MQVGNLSSGSAQIQESLDKLEMAWARSNDSLARFKQSKC